MRARQKKVEDEWAEGAPERERKAEEYRLSQIEAMRREEWRQAQGSDPFGPHLYYLFGGG